jgi:predicted nuclease with TOPRIM domain
MPYMSGSKNMELREEDLQAVGEYVREHLPEWLLQRDVELRESQVRLETELKGQRELLQQNMALMEKRFEQVDKRFEQVDKRFEEMFHYMDKRFEEMLHFMDKRFEQVDKRFESVEKRLISIETSLRRFIYSSFSFSAAAAGLIIAVMKLT